MAGWCATAKEKQCITRMLSVHAPRCMRTSISLEHVKSSMTSEPCLQAMLDQFSSEDRRFRELDSALSDAMQLMRMSDARVHNLRKMHAMVLLQQ